MARFFSFRKWFDRLVGSASFSRRKGVTGKLIRLRLEELEDRLAPATTLSIADASAIEPAPGGTVNMDFTVTRTGDLSAPLTVSYTTIAGTAQPNTDFTPQNGTTTFAAGSAAATISIPIFGNGVYNAASLTFSVELTGVGPPALFGTPLPFNVGTSPSFVAAADVNGDGKPDLIVTNYNNKTVSVLLNTTAPGATTPAFATRKTFATGSGPVSVAAADVIHLRDPANVYYRQQSLLRGGGRHQWRRQARRDRR